MKKGILIIVLLVFTSSLIAQVNETIDIVRVKVVSSGKSEAAALTEGLRSALTQASGVFISSNTSIIDDQIAKDQVTMINNGSIADYKILDKYQSNEQFTLTLDVGVSINKLGSFVKNSGGETELQGSLFAANIKINELNEKAEVKSILDLIEVSNALVKSCFDYEIKNGEPKNEDGKWAIPLQVKIIKNKNWNEFTNYFYSTLKQISMTEKDIDKYVKLNLPLYTIGLFDNRDIPHSTPTISYKAGKADYLRSIQKKELTLDYYLVKQPPNKDLEIVFLANGVKEAIAYHNKFTVDYYQKQQSELIPYFLTTNSAGKFNLITLRKEESYEVLQKYFLNLHQQIRNVDITNGLTRFNLKMNNNSPKAVDFKNQGEASCFPISTFSGDDAKNHFFSGTSFDLHFAGRGYGEVRYLNISLENWMKFSGWDYKSHVLRNKLWEQKMIEPGGYSCGLVSDSLAHADYFDERSRNYSKSYFEYVFGNFTNYHLNVKKIINSYTSGNGYNMVRHFPIQLTLIGDDNNIAFAFWLTNYLSTEDISKVKKYTIERKN